MLIIGFNLIYLKVPYHELIFINEIFTNGYND